MAMPVINNRAGRPPRSGSVVDVVRGDQVVVQVDAAGTENLLEIAPHHGHVVRHR
jgi:hypothetical protein